MAANCFSWGISNDKFTPPIKKLKRGKIKINPIAIKKTGICLPCVSCNFFAWNLITIIAIIVVFEFTIGKTLNKITRQTDVLLTKEGRKQMVNTIKVEMEKAVKKENYLKEDERILINKFINKIKAELNSVK